MEVTEADENGVPVSLPLSAVLQQISGGVRCLVEGEDVLKAKHIIECSVKGVRQHAVDVIAFVLQTSALTEPPHRVDITLLDEQVKSATCTCKAGLSHRCKHVVAVLLYINRNESLPRLSCTDMPQQWGRESKKTARAMYEPRQCKDLACVQKAGTLTTLPSAPKDTRERLMSGLPYRCPLLRHTTKVPPGDTGSATDSNKEQDPADIYMRLGLAPPLHVLVKAQREKLEAVSKENLLAFLKGSYSDCAVDKIEEATRGQSNEPLWHLYRKGLLSASISHACLTRATRVVKEPRPHNLRGLIATVMQRRLYTSEMMRRGLALENEARSTFSVCIRGQGHDGFVQTCGLLISKLYPFIGCSLDGIFVYTCKCCEGKKALLEIKCPKSLDNAFRNRDCEEPRAQYKTQMNVQMGISGIHKCHFFVYHVSGVSKDWKHVIVTYNESDFIDYCNAMAFLFTEYLLSELMSD